jgi:hypothetical protein
MVQGDELPVGRESQDNLRLEEFGDSFHAFTG